MIEKNITISFTFEQQLEIERIVIDEDKESAFELVKQIKEEIKKRVPTGCKPAFEI